MFSSMVAEGRARAAAARIRIREPVCGMPGIAAGRRRPGVNNREPRAGRTAGKSVKSGNRGKKTSSVVLLRRIWRGHNAKPRLPINHS